MGAFLFLHESFSGFVDVGLLPCVFFGSYFVVVTWTVFLSLNVSVEENGLIVIGNRIA